MRHHVPGAPILLCGAKNDLRDNHNEVFEFNNQNKNPLISFEEGCGLVKKLKLHSYCENSAKTQKVKNKIKI